MSNAEIKRISEDDIQEFVFAHAHEDETSLLLRAKPIAGVSAGLIAQQIAGRRKAEVRLPLFFETRGVVYPPSLNWEQASSEATARLKADLIVTEVGANFIGVDLTGGFGVDTFFLSQHAKHFDYVEPVGEVAAIARHNHEVLGSKNISYHTAVAEKYLNENGVVDVAYLDPSRRNSERQKVFRLSDCTPNVVTILPQLLDKAKVIVLKAAPMLDIHQGLGELQGYVYKVVVVSVNNECKELLFLIRKENRDEPVIETFNIAASKREHFSFQFSDEKKCVSEISDPLTYLYEPNASLLKAGAFKLIGQKFGSKKIQVNTHFYTSNELLSDFPGRVFKIEQLHFDAKSSRLKKANVIARNFPLTADALKKKLKLQDGGEWYVIAFSGQRKKFIVLATRLE